MSALMMAGCVSAAEQEECRQTGLAILGVIFILGYLAAVIVDAFAAMK